MRDNAATLVGVPPVVLFLAAGAVVAAALGSSFAGMYELWQRSAHQHGIVVFPAVLWLIWRAPAAALRAPYRPSALALFVLAGNLLVWLAGRLAGIQAIEHLAALAAIPIGFTALAGWQVAWQLRFPLAFVLLALPVSDVLVPGMMRITADIAEFLLALIGVPFYRVGQNISLPGGEFVVAEVCSGVRYFTAGMLTLLLFGYLSFSSITKQVLLLVVGAAALVFANGFRAFATMVIASATEMHVLGGSDHVYFGWVLFGIVIFSLLLLASRFADPDAGAPDDGAPARPLNARTGLRLGLVLAAAMLIATLNPLQSTTLQAVKLALAAAFAVGVIIAVRRSLSGSSRAATSATAASSRLIGVTLTGSLLLAGTGWIARGVAANEVRDAALPALTPPPDCTTAAGWPATWRPEVARASEERDMRLVCASGETAVFAASFDSALSGGELVSSGHRFWPRAAERVPAAVRDLGDARVSEVTVAGDDGPWLVWQWYAVNGKRTATAMSAKQRQILALLRHRPAGGRIVVVATRLEPGGDGDARARLRRAMDSVGG